MKTMKTIMLSSALVLGATLAHAQVVDPARPGGQGATSKQPAMTETAPAHEPSRVDRGNTARSMDAPAGIAPQPRAGATNPMNDPARPDADGATA